jgi:hypothetical protein
MRSITICRNAPTKYYTDDKVKNNVVSRACDAYRGEERCIKGFGGGT